MFRECTGAGRVLGSDESKGISPVEDGGRQGCICGRTSGDVSDGDGRVELLEEGERDGGDVDSLAESIPDLESTVELLGDGKRGKVPWLGS